MVKIMEKLYFLMDDLGEKVPLFSVQHPYMDPFPALFGYLRIPNPPSSNPSIFSAFVACKSSPIRFRRSYHHHRPLGWLKRPGNEVTRHPLEVKQLAPENKPSHNRIQKENISSNQYFSGTMLNFGVYVQDWCDPLVGFVPVHFATGDPVRL